ncbi:MAG: response regulator transcription factor [Clostridiaceae bacterium]|nr:response regulator transcription factor [Clostridiaceae bacterium]
MQVIKVLLVDDQIILLDGLRAILETDERIKVIGGLTNGEEALAAIKSDIPDVVLMDIRMPGMDGVLCTKKIKETWPQIAVLMLTTFNDEEYIVDALKYGACGYLLKDIKGEKLIQAVKDAQQGDTILPSKIAALIANHITVKPKSNEEKIKAELSLSDREAELAVMLSQGFTNKQIATALFISEGTVKNYISSIYRKLGVEDRTMVAIKISKIIK